MANNKAFKVKNGLELGAISDTITDTALAVFVYDTRKDSDGGQWRHRTQHTSWYNETLNTSTRGSRKEFPAVAVIVAESNAVTIYDGDDPDLPMWMVFGEGRILAVSSTYQATAVTALNGTIAVTRPTYGLSHVNFISELAVWYHNDTQERLFLKPITGRGTSSGATFTTDAPPISNAEGNDVAMVALPNAPIDAATGLPVPTFAVATNNRVSVIKDDGTVVTSNTSSVFESVMFNGTELYAEDTTFADDTQYYGDVGSLSDSFPTFRNFYSYTPSYEKLSSSVLSTFNGNILTPLGEPRSFAVGLAADSSTNASWTALNMVKDHSPLNGYAARTALVSYINTDFNTGWMNGDIKLATLSDTDDTNVTGSELVTNGTFGSDISGWTDDSDGGGSISWNASGYMDVVHTTGTARALQNVTLVTGKTYTCSVEVISETGNGYIYLGTTSSAGEYFAHQITSTGVKTFTFVAGTTVLALRMSNFAPGTLSVDNVSVRLAEEDRSVNGNGLQVFGTVTKSAVATGADLVAYSGFNAGNYLQQPYNSAMDIDATDDVCVIVWAKLKAGNSYIFDRTDSANTGSRYFAYRRGGADDKLVFMGLQSSTAFDDTFAAEWHQYTLLRRNGTIEIWVDGRLDATGADTQDRTNTSAVLTIGNNYSLGANNGAEALALFRFSVTAPSPEQIKKIYEDEKVLFQEGAQATLYGDSDVVKALAYDDSTDLLHVGTSGSGNGRSVFRGLRRVDNTTLGVSVAISASNGLVADE